MAVVVEAVYGRRKGESRAGGTGRYKGEKVILLIIFLGFIKSKPC